MATAAPPTPTLRARVVAAARRWFGAARRRAAAARGMLPAADVLSASLGALHVTRVPPARASELTAVITRQPEALADLWRDLMRMDDAAPDLLRTLVDGNRAALDDVPVISLGTHCFTAAMMKRWRLKPWSGPFDWTFSSLAMVRHCLEDDFTAFLDRDQYEPVPPESRVDGPTVNRVDHRLYRTRFGVRFVFNHHDAHLDDDHAYLTRCVQRLRDALASPGPKYFLAFTARRASAMDDVLALRDTLAARTSNFRLAVFLVDREPGRPPSLAVTHADDTLAVWTFAPRSKWQALHFDDRVDELLAATTVHGDLCRFLDAGARAEGPADAAAPRPEGP